MKKNRFRLLAVIALVLTLIPVSTALADRFPEDCDDGQWVVRGDQTLGFVAFNCGTTVEELVALNGIDNPNLIFPGEVLLIPGPGVEVPVAPAPVDPDPVVPEVVEPEVVVPAPPVFTGSTADVDVTFGALTYGQGGREARVNITVTNNGVFPAIDGGRQYFGENPDGGKQYVTLLGVSHQLFPIALIDDAPVWRADVTFSDGNTATFPVGCFYDEVVEYIGFEPTGPDTGFVWEVNWEGGWYDCGNDYEDDPVDIIPGASGTDELIIYVQHPRLWNSDEPINRTVESIAISLWVAEGEYLPNVGFQTFN